MSETNTPEFLSSATYPDVVGKVAVVTGGSRGPGAATAMALGPWHDTHRISAKGWTTWR